MSFDRDKMKAQAAELAARNVFVGTSSWKYEGWLGQLYSPNRYKYRGKVARSRFERDCLAEYAEVFKTVCVDAAYYDFPKRDRLRALSDQTPGDFRFGLKVTDAIPLKQFPNLHRFGAEAGRPNADFLNADLFGTAFLGPCEAIREKIGVLMFEFSRFWPVDYARGRDFLADLDVFLGKLPKGWPYAVEMRNGPWLGQELLLNSRGFGLRHCGCLRKLANLKAGVVAQLVEHHNGIVGVRGSNPLGSTSFDWDRIAAMGLLTNPLGDLAKRPGQLQNGHIERRTLPVQSDTVHGNATSGDPRDNATNTVASACRKFSQCD